MALISNSGKYSKLITAIVAGAIGFATLVVQSKSSAITSTEWLVGGTYLASALGVYLVPNTPTTTPPDTTPPFSHVPPVVV